MWVGRDINGMSRDDAPADERDTVTNPPPLAHRTDRVAMRNASETPVVFVDNDPFSYPPTEDRKLRNQRTSLDVDSVTEAKAAMRTLAERFDADTGRRWYYAIAGERAQISGNGMDDHFDALDNFRTVYADLEDQLGEPRKYQRRGYPHDYMQATSVAVTSVDGLWLRFVTALSEDDAGEHHLGSSLWVTTTQRHGPLVARWLDDVFDIDVVGPPESVESQHCTPQKSIGLSDEPREAPRQLRMIGVGGEREEVNEGGEYISCANPCYDPDGEREMFHRLRGGGVNDTVIRTITQIDRLPLRVYGGSHGTDEDLYVGRNAAFTELGGTDRVVLVSGKTSPVLKEEYEAEGRGEPEASDGAGVIERVLG